MPTEVASLNYAKYSDQNDLSNFKDDKNSDMKTGEEQVDGIVSLVM
jgi:hypothetical protein